LTILSDKDILESIKLKELSIEPFLQHHLTPNGYDLSVEEVYIKKNQQYFREGKAIIPGLTWFVISTREFIKMGPSIASQLWIRSSYARKGIMASFGKVDAGFHGTLTISCFNANDDEIEIPIGDRFCQIVFEFLSNIPCELYENRSGTYQNQRGITL
jgi:dCTP deaminase